MNYERMNYTFVGVDSHKDSHYAVILNCFCERLGAIEIRNAPSSFESFIQKLEALKIKDTTLTFGFEDTSEYGTSLVRYLISKGFEVRHCNASLVANERKSANVLHKTDDFDAQCVGVVLITKYNSLPISDPKDEYLILKQLVTRRSYILKSYTGLKRQLHRMIAKNYPDYKKFFYVLDCPSSLAFFENYPSPSTLESVSKEGLLEFFWDVAPRLPKKEERVFKILNSISTIGDTTIQYQDYNDFIIQSIIRQMKASNEEIKKIEDKLVEVIELIPQKLTTIKGVNNVTCALLLAEIGDVSRFKTASKLARFAGVSPVTYSSGKSMLQFANEKGNRSLSAIMFCIAVSLSTPHGRNSTAFNPVFNRYYMKKVSEGKTKKQALKCVQRRLINIIYSMLKNNTEYINPEE
jgi:transposase